MIKRIVTIKDTNLSCLSFSFLAIPAAFCFSRYSAYRSRLRTMSTGWIIKLRNTCSACIVAALLFAVSPPPPPWHWHKSLGSVFLIYHLRLHHHSQFLSHLVLLNSPALQDQVDSKERRIPLAKLPPWFFFAPQSAPPAFSGCKLPISPGTDDVCGKASHCLIFWATCVIWDIFSTRSILSRSIFFTTSSLASSVLAFDHWSRILGGKCACCLFDQILPEKGLLWSQLHHQARLKGSLQCPPPSPLQSRLHPDEWLL